MGRVESSHDGGDPGSAAATRQRPRLFQPECYSRGIFAQINFTISQLHSQWGKGKKINNQGCVSPCKRHRSSIACAGTGLQEHRPIVLRTRLL